MKTQYDSKDSKNTKPLKAKPNLNEGKVTIGKAGEGLLQITINGSTLTIVDPKAHAKLRSEVAKLRDDISNMKQAIRALSKR